MKNNFILLNKPFHPFIFNIGLIMAAIKCFIDFLLLFLGATLETDHEFFQINRMLLFHLIRNLEFAGGF